MYSSNSNQKLAVKQMGHALLSSMGSVCAENHVGPGAEISPTCVFPLSRLRLAPKAGSKSRGLCAALRSRERAQGWGGRGADSGRCTAQVWCQPRLRVTALRRLPYRTGAPTA